MSMLKRIESKLKEAFQPERLEVLNESHKHAGHAGGHGHAPFEGEGETHLRVRITSAAFAGKSRVERHRALNAVLKEELQDGVHALALEITAPGEPVRR
jgi:BolA protein